MGASLRRLRRVIALSFVLKHVFNFGKGCITEASRAQEVENVVKTAFGNMTEEADKFVKKALEEFGMNETTAKEISSKYMLMGTNSGLSKEQAANFAFGATGRAGDISSFYNLTVERADILMQAIYTGETESLKDIGVSMTNKSLQSFAVSQGIKKQISDMSQAELVQLRYYYVMQKTGLAAGDFKKNTNSWANQVKLLNQRIKKLKESIGAGIIENLAPLLKALNKLLSALIWIAELFREITELLFGKQALPDKQETKPIEETISIQAEGQQVKAEKIEEETKKRKSRSLQGFDELNRLGSNGSEAKAEAITNNPKIKLVVDKQEDQKKEEPKQEPNNDDDFYLLERAALIRFKAHESLERLKKAIKKIMLPALKWFYYEFLVPLAKWTIEDSAPAFINLLIGALQFLQSIIKLIIPSWKGISPLVKGLGKALISLLNWAYLALFLFRYEVIYKAKWHMLKFIDDLPGFIEAHKYLLAALTGFITGGAIAILVITKLSAIMATLKVAVFTVGTVFGTLINPATITIAAIGLLIGALYYFITDWENISQKFKENKAKLEIRALFLFNFLIVDVANPIKEKFNNMFSSFYNTINSTTKTIKEFSKRIGNALINAIYKITLNVIPEKFTKLINALISIVERGINHFINQFNTISFTKPSGEVLGPNIKPVHIPRLALGAVIPSNAKFLAALGDQTSGSNILTSETDLRKDISNSKRYDVPEVKTFITNDQFSYVSVVYSNGKEERKRVSKCKITI